MKKTHFTGAGVDTFRFEFAEAIKEFEQKTGLKFNLGRITYDAKQLSGKLTVTIVNEGENPQDAIFKTDLKRNGWMFGLSEHDFNKRIEYLGSVYSLKSVKARRQKFPIVAKKESTGQVFKLPASCLK